MHADICGPINPSTLAEKHDYLLIIDDFSRYLWVALLKDKSDAFEHFKRFKSLAEVEKGEKTKCLRSDCGGEFLTEEFITFSEVNGIWRQLTAPYTP